ncbi:16S rRNA (guanine(966)-N(2))-methyltransferase RsmD [Glaciecola sp. SC05]|uniref:16S rRNA (guanine(966)-N(2))-methyltransferase RsmD n=1 Tax=Glaciecola sp. SC05 TaxID=1987355 RepID=UPI0035294D81
MTPSPKARPRNTRNAHRPSARFKPGNIRIISGQHRGRKLPVLLAEGLRPTTDRVKETLFNWLMQDIAGAKVLDMFAGAGSLGFEAISRQAAFVTMIENNIKSAAQLKQNIEVLKAKHQSEVICEDAFEALKNKDESYDIVFIDPPFHKGFVMRAVDALLINNSLKPGALVYIESEASFNENLHPSLIKIKENSTQQVNYRLYRVAEN